jgi:penicillin-binding protein 1C
LVFKYLYKIKRYILANKKKAILIGVLLIAYYFSLPKNLFDKPTSTVITAKNGMLLGAKIAQDGQWRFPAIDTVPKKFEDCILLFEDEYFYKHPGFNPVAIAKAFKTNWNAGRVKRGGSTITQQVIRLSRQGKGRNYIEKLKEIILATRLEFRYSKENILRLYASHAPFGGNVVGLNMASWRYFHKQANELTWSESATLAVLPNAPSLIFPGKNRKRLLVKRNRLLKKLFEANKIDKTTYALSLLEELPNKPYALPQIAPHLLEKINSRKKGKYIQTTLDFEVQQQVNSIVKRHYLQLKQNEIYNMAVLVLDVRTRQVVAYIGNSPTDNAHQKDVDIINKPRSTGSVLKPILYAAMLDNGELLPNSLVPDVPSQFGTYQPKNYTKEYDGAVPASQALSRSLNVPAVLMLKHFGKDRFYHYLKGCKLRDIKYGARHYGLSVILGGAESNLWDLCQTYAAFSGTINHYTAHNARYFTNEFVSPSYYAKDKIDFGNLSAEKPLLDAGSLWLTYEALKEVNRPQADSNWKDFSSSQAIAWKTGTSYGNRDAWAIGTTKDYVVGVWVGNADGEGRPGLVGVATAAPVLFEVFETLPASDWFEQPFDAMQQVLVCEKSGYKASKNCEKTKKQWIAIIGERTKKCPYHRLIHLDNTTTYRVNSSCESVSDIVHKPWFVLPPLMEFYYKKRHIEYKALPPFRLDCITGENATMAFIYPKANARVFLPKDFEGKKQELILELSHSQAENNVFWYLDDMYIGTTSAIHTMRILPEIGVHYITVVDEYGNELRQKLTIEE